MEITPTIKPTIKQYEAWKAWWDPDILFVFLGGGAGGGKAQPLNSVVWTPFGSRKMGELGVGDVISTPEGSTSRILAVHPQGKKQIYSVVFYDGAKTRTTGEHLWFAWEGQRRGRAKLYTTTQLKLLVESGKNILIPLPEPVVSNVTLRNSFFSPYVLGVLLGDGGLTNSVSFTSADDEIVEKIRGLGFNVTKWKNKYSYGITGIAKDIKKLGLFGKKSEEKFIPKEYLFAPVAIRLELVRGLMDTDGTVSKDGKLYYCTTSEKLANNLQFILRSLGAKVTITRKENSNLGAFILYINSRDNSMFLSLSRKKSRTRPHLGVSRRIVSIKEDGLEEAKCITLDNPSGLYLTDDFIVTHNSWFLCEVAITQSYQYPGIKSFIGRKELKRLMGSTYITFHKVLAHHNIPKENWRIDGKYNYLENLTNGSRIDLLDLDYMPSDPLYERFGSLEYTNGFVDEAPEVRFGGIDVLKTRVGRHKNKEFDLPGKIGMTGNPSKDWPYRIFYKPWKEDKLPKEYAFIQALYNDNPHTQEIYGRQLAQITDPVQKERLMFGNWEYDEDKNALIAYDAILDLFSNPPITDEDYIIADVARYGKDRTVIGYWRGYDLAEIKILEKRGVDGVAEEIRNLSLIKGVPRSHILIDEDGVGGGVMDILNGSRGFVANSQPFDGNFKNLKAQCSYKIADLVNSRTLSISAQLSESSKQEIIEDLGWIKSKDADKDAKRQVMPKDEVKEHLGRSPDFGDMIMMRGWFDVSPQISTQGFSSYTPKLREFRIVKSP